MLKKIQYSAKRILKVKSTPLSTDKEDSIIMWKSFGWAFNINWRYVQRKNVVNNVKMSSSWTPWQKARTQTNTQNNTKHVEHQDATAIHKLLFFVFLVTSIFLKKFHIKYENLVISFISNIFMSDCFAFKRVWCLIWTASIKPRLLISHAVDASWVFLFHRFNLYIETTAYLKMVCII